MRHQTSLHLLWFGLAMFAGASLPVLGGSGCGGSRCSPSNSSVGDPSSSVECPGGTICYQGQCVETCNAGSEKADVCTSDEDCGGGRPYCSPAGFCSACAPPSACIPSLDVCAGLIPRPPDEIGGVDGGPGRSTQEPLDSGPLDPPRFGRYDGGPEEGPQAISLSHTATVTLRALRDRGQPAIVQAFAQVDTLRTGVVATRRACIKNPATPPGAACEEFANPGGSCGLYRKLTWSVPPEQGDLGKFLLRDPKIDVPGGGVIPNGVEQTVELAFDRALGRYRVTTPQPIPSDLMLYSADRTSLLEFEATGSPLTKGQSFPVRSGGDLPTHPMPLELCDPGLTNVQGCYGNLGTGSYTMLRQNPIVGDHTLDFDFTIPNGARATPDGGVYQSTDGELYRIEVIIDGDRHEIRCIANRDAESHVLVPLGILQRFRVAEGMRENNLQDTVDLYFQRVYRYRAAVPINLEHVPPARTDLRLEIAYVWKTTLAF